MPRSAVAPKHSACAGLGKPPSIACPHERLVIWWSAASGCKVRVFAFTKPSICCIGCCWEGRAGRGAEVASVSTASFGPHGAFRKPEKLASSTGTYSLAPSARKLTGSPKPIVPASPNRPAVPDARCPLHFQFRRFAIKPGLPRSAHGPAFQRPVRPGRDFRSSRHRRPQPRRRQAAPD